MSIPTWEALTWVSTKSTLIRIQAEEMTRSVRWTWPLRPKRTTSANLRRLRRTSRAVSIACSNKREIYSYTRGCGNCGDSTPTSKRERTDSRHLQETLSIGIKWGDSLSLGEESPTSGLRRDLTERRRPSGLSWRVRFSLSGRARSMHSLCTSDHSKKRFSKSRRQERSWLYFTTRVSTKDLTSWMRRPRLLQLTHLSTKLSLREIMSEVWVKYSYSVASTFIYTAKCNKSTTLIHLQTK